MRSEFAARLGTYEPSQLIFVDESAVDRRCTYRGRAWAIRGRKASRKAFFCRGRRSVLQVIAIVITNSVLLRFSVLPALSMDGILHCDIVEGAFDSELFYQFINRLLDEMQPFPARNSVIVMDNCRIHKNPAILELIESRCVLIIHAQYIFTHIKPVECATSSCLRIRQITIPLS
jgi:hypothetical protein